MSNGIDPAPPETDAAPSGVACAACHEAAVDHYFEINRTIVCEPCRRSIEDQLRGGPNLASLSRAALFGIGASVLGSTLYLGFLLFSAYDWSLIAVLLGYLVGKMVRKGSGGLGGTACQMLAVALTYASLGMAYFGYALLEFRQGNQAALPPSLSPGVVLSILAQAFQMPVVLMKSSPIRIAIVGFALWEAWKLNRPRRFTVTGPHRVVVAEAGPLGA